MFIDLKSNSPIEVFMITFGKKCPCFHYARKDVFTLEADLNLADKHMNSQDKLIIYLHPEVHY